jgi:hypothetical protein
MATEQPKDGINKIFKKLKHLILSPNLVFMFSLI